MLLYHVKLEYNKLYNHVFGKVKNIRYLIIVVCDENCRQEISPKHSNIYPFIHRTCNFVVP